jgi:D-alanyl-lipoteichoic acid acyltransferase DltB (MBOAT superfamily)
MQFNSLDFLIFFVLFIGLWPIFRRYNNSRWIYLTAASFVFYGWWDWRFLFLLAGSGLIDFVAALGMQRLPRRRKLLLVLSLAGNLGALGTFKYLDFGLANLNRALGLLGLDATVPLAHLTLPVGISFYTFQSMSYTIDVYRRQLVPTRNVFHFFAYLAMFPQLVAGPIVRAADLLPQLTTARPTTEPQRWAGLKLILAGYAKKVVLADNLAPLVQGAFAAGVPSESGAFWWVIMVMFAFQIYCDFSGYSDIARGLAHWMGYDFPLNFDHPYIASSFRDFWTRWHISLSTWFRDYLYIPLGGSRGTTAASYRNLWITMVLSGIWHGAAWTMVAWSVLHAAYLSIERLTSWPRRLAALPGGRHLATSMVFALVVLAWVPFRATSMTQAIHIGGTMLNLARFDAAGVAQLIDTENWLVAVMLGVLALRQLYFHLGLDRVRWELPAPARALEPVAMAGLLWACVLLRGPGQEFIYFQF